MTANLVRYVECARTHFRSNYNGRFWRQSCRLSIFKLDLLVVVVHCAISDLLFYANIHNFFVKTTPIYHHLPIVHLLIVIIWRFSSGRPFWLERISTACYDTPTRSDHLQIDSPLLTQLIIQLIWAGMIIGIIYRWYDGVVLLMFTAAEIIVVYSIATLFHHERLLRLIWVLFKA